MIPPCVRSETPVVGYDTSLCPFFWVGIPILLRSTWEAAPQRIPIPDPLARSWIAHSSSNLSPQVDCVCLGSPASPRWSPVPSDPAGVASTALIQGPESPMLHPPHAPTPPTALRPPPISCSTQFDGCTPGAPRPRKPFLEPRRRPAASSRCHQHHHVLIHC